MVQTELRLAALLTQFIELGDRWTVRGVGVTDRVACAAVAPATSRQFSAPAATADAAAAASAAISALLAAHVDVPVDGSAVPVDGS